VLQDLNKLLSRFSLKENRPQQAEGATGNVLDFLGGELANSHFETS
jgi:hypothetical protein